MTSKVPHSSPNTISVEKGLGKMYDDYTDTFQILNEVYFHRNTLCKSISFFQKNVSFLLYPELCNDGIQLLLLVSSGPKNYKNRERWREVVKGLSEIKLVFLVSLSGIDHVDQSVAKEYWERNDILESSLNDGHRKLGYKILTGFVLASKNCAIIKFVGKTDDNVALIMERFMCWRNEDGWLKIGSCVKKPHIHGNWSVSKDQIEVDIVPDFCAGFLYLTSLKVGGELVQVGVALFGAKNMIITKDSLIAGSSDRGFQKCPLTCYLTPLKENCVHG